MRKLFARASMIVLLAAAVGTAPALAGGALETLDITAGTPSPIPGQIVAKLVRIFWDPRTIPVKYKMNNTLDPIPNPLGAPFLSVAAAQAELQNGFNAWNAIPTSYIDMRITGTVANPGVRGFDMINELTFRTTAGFTAIASSPSVSLIDDENLTNGTDLDGDGDSDVSSAITTSADVDGDGDIEMPAGFYKAGTILENDIQFNTKTTNGFRFTVDPAAADTVTRSVDLLCVAIHEEGHSHGLSHVLDNQISATDGTGTTMYPFIDTGDPAAELSQRTLGTDDIAWSSYFYPEGTASSGPAALQPGDVKFSLVYGLIKGAVRHGVLNEPVAGASVSATNAIGNSFFSSGFSGTTQVSYDPATGGLFLVDPAFDIINGNYVIPVKLGLWKVGMEATDGFPVSSGSISLTAQIGDIFGQQNFNEEFWDGPLEGAVELQPGLAIPVAGIPGVTVNNINLVTNDQTNIANFGSLDFVGFTGSTPGTYYAVRIPASDISAFNPGQLIQIQEGLFHTFVLDASVVPVYAEATLATGTVSGVGGATATIDLAHPLAKTNGFIGQDNDFAPFYFPAPLLLGAAVRAGIQSGHIQNLFLVLRVPTTTPFPGVSAAPPLIGLDGGVAANDAPIFGYSYTSTDGAAFNQVTNFNFRFALVLAAKP
jgi:hypothetical protein